MSKSIEKLTMELAAHEADYLPNDSVLESIQHKTFVGIIGPLAVGKSTLIREATELDNEFHEIQGITTRPQRPREELGEFRAFWPHDIDTLHEINNLREHGNLVQYAVHPKTRYVYASTLEDYGPTYNLLPVLPGNLQQFKNMPFKQQHHISITCTPREWMHRFLERAEHMEKPDINKRLLEAKENIAWSLEQPDMQWVTNWQGRAHDAARKVIDIARGELITAKHSRKAGELLLRHIENELADL